MMRWLPHPVLSIFLLTMWLLLNQSVGLGHIILGSGLAVGGALILTALEPPAIRFRRPRAILELLFLVLSDIIRSNIAVSRIILGPKPRSQTDGFLDIPLELRSPYGLTTLAIIITSTPGTLWVNFDSPTRVLTIHVLDLVDENAWIATIKRRYERLLLEIFE